MQRYVIVIEYIGTNYAGSQKQGGLQDIEKVFSSKMKDSDSEQILRSDEPITTIQGELEKALSTLTRSHNKDRGTALNTDKDALSLNKKGTPLDNKKNPKCDQNKIKTIFSGRTDAGVHAKEQYVHFDTDYDCDNEKFINSLNGLLPKDISVKSVQKVENNFHAQKSAVARWYRYCIKNRKQRSAWDQNCLLVREPLDAHRMNKALSYIEGKHDCTSFKKLKTDNPAKICEIYKAICHQHEDVIYIDIIANRFLYNMIRTIVGTLLMIEKNSLAPETLQEILEAKDRNKAGPTISPNGLTLMKVIYNKENMEIAYENLFS